MQAIRKFGSHRAAITAAAMALLVVLGGCVVYPADGYRDGGYGYRGHGGYGYGGHHHGGYERYEWDGHGRGYW